MKVKDLQIGDYVTAHGKVTCVCGIYMDRMYGYDGCDVREASVHPIFLTDELLVSIGFRTEDNAHFYWSRRKEGCDITIIKDNGAYRITANHIGSLPIEFLHEMQQPLRLCGYRDFANNIKLE